MTLPVDHEFRMSHRQLVSAVLSLLDDPQNVMHRPFFYLLGYRLEAIELPMIDKIGRRYAVDLLIANQERECALLIDCKTWPDEIHDEQINRYLRTSSEEVIRQSGMSVLHPGQFSSDALFVILPDVESSLISAIGRCKTRETSGVSLLAVHSSFLQCVHDEFSDPELSASLAGQWEVNARNLPLERLPYEPRCSRFDLADAIFQTILSYFIQGRRTFTAESICEDSNEWWPYFGPLQQMLQRRVREELRTIAKTALPAWIRQAKDDSGMVTHWEFKKPSSVRKQVLEGYARRHSKYLEIVKLPHGNPTKQDFVGIDDAERDQLTLHDLRGQVVQYGEEAERLLTPHPLSDPEEN